MYYVLGLGISGTSAARFLIKRGEAVVGIDREFKNIQGLKQVLDTEAVEFERGSVLVVSPGVSTVHPIYLKARRQGIEIVGEAELACRFLRNRAAAITGTNGKTSVTMMTAHALNASGLKARALGNIGEPLCDHLQNSDPDEIFVIELSSFQLETMQSPVFDAGIILNITPDHLDRYPSMKDYAEAKLRIAGCLKAGAPFFADRQTVENYGASARIFSESASYIQRNREAALALARTFGISEQQFYRAMESFMPPPHRLEFVRKVGGISYYDDSKGTNIDAVSQAVQTLKEPIVLIAGGRDKGAGYGGWIKNFTGKVKAVCAIGEAAQKIEGDLSPHFRVILCGTLERALEEAAALAAPGDAVLLSPGCASYDMFKDYKERGEKFKNLVNARKEIE